MWNNFLTPKSIRFFFVDESTLIDLKSVRASGMYPINRFGSH